MADTVILGGGGVDGYFGKNPDWSKIKVKTGRTIWSSYDDNTLQAWLVEDTNSGGVELAGGNYANPIQVAGNGLPRIAGYFVDGFVFENPNQVGIDASGNSWQYVGTSPLPHTVTAGTVPSSPDYELVFTNDHNNLANRNAVGSHDDIYTRNYDNVASLISETDIGEMEGKKVKTKGYYSPGDLGGAEYIINLGNTGDNLTDHNIGGYTAVLQSDVVDIRQSGAKTDIGYDNVNHIKSAVKKGVGVVPLGKFYSSPIRFGADFDFKSLIGLGYDSVLSMISPAGASIGSPLIHIPRDGGAYGGTEVGAKNFYIDKLRLYGGDTTSENTFSTTGLVLENSEGFNFGVLWVHGFYKSGMLLDGTCKKMTGDKVFSYDNGNQAGASTGGQGIASSIDNTDGQAFYINYAECWDNGVQNFGQGLDAASGNFGFGTLNIYNNGSSAMKVVNAQKVKIGTLISSSNNKHVAQPFPALYTNGDFGVVDIDYFESSSPASSSLAHTRDGKIKIGHFISSGSVSSGITLSPTSGFSVLDIGNAEVSGSGLTGLTASGNFKASFGKFKVSGSNSQGAVISDGEAYFGEYESIDNNGTPLFFNSGNDHFVGKFSSTSTVSNTALVVGASVNNACIVSARSSGSHIQTLSDSGVNTYKPNVI